MALQAQRGGSDIAPNQSQPWHQKGVGGQHRAPLLYPQEILVTNCTGDLVVLGQSARTQQISPHWDLTLSLSGS
jgi:hypothetical protein